MYGEKAVAEGRVQILPNGIDLTGFTHDPIAKQAVRAEYGIPQSAFVVGHVGRFVYQKNHAFLLKIFTVLSKERPDAYLLLFGEGKLREELRRQVTEAGLAERVIFAGVRRDVSKCYSAMDVFCLPSFYEGMPVVAIEAQANGLPCLCSDAVSREAAAGPGFQQLSLERPAGEWAEQLCALAKMRSTSTGVVKQMDRWDIRKHALRLQQWYEAAARPSGKG